MNDILERVKAIIKGSYNSYACGNTEERSSGNDMDVFNDGYECGKSDLAYEIGVLLGMELEEPREPKYSWE